MATGKVGKDILIEGRVQGVGFRPHVYRLARRHRISGAVWNSGGAVRIRAAGQPADLDAFVAGLGGGVGQARITRIEVADAPPPPGDAFVVQASEARPAAGASIPPDLPLCPDCARELEQPGRRHGHFLSNCAGCGPRFSVIRALPYDRQRTTMAEFAPCPDCAREYADPANRRFHAETICCNACGPVLRYFDGAAEAGGGAALELAAERLRRGGVALVKGVGGYHLAASPWSGGALAALRRIKRRDEQPFAVMFADPGQAGAHCLVADAEREALLSPARPIVPLALRGENGFAPEALRGEARCGAFLPYAPLHFLLLRRTGPLVVTSANASGSAILHRDAEALDFLAAHRPDLDGILFHDRAILRPVEDSVVDASGPGFPRVLRRARGYAPAPLPLAEAGPPLIALGGDLKASFCLAEGGWAYPSQHFGDLEDAGAFDNWRREIPAFRELLGAAPELALCDRHPGYVSARHARELGLPLFRVQHHHAHIASVMAEAGLDGPVIGVAFDGVGYGDDGAVWGGEFLLCEGGLCRRLAHLEYLPLVGGDQAVREARRTAACFLLGSGLPLPAGWCGPEEEALLAAAVASGVGRARSSSMGRLFDAVAALTGTAFRNSYEGQCAIALQRAAEAALRRGLAPAPLEFEAEEWGETAIIGCRGILRRAAARDHGDRDAFALGFHLAVANLVAKACGTLGRREGIGQVALSGGVFQNSLLLRLCLDALKAAGLEAHCNRLVPPNDGGLALGQALIGRRLARAGRGQALPE